MTDNSPRIMLFDLNWTGHHLQYLTQLAEYWIDSRCVGILEIVVSTQFVKAHPEFSQYIEQEGPRAGIRLHTADIDIDMLSGSAAKPFTVDRENDIWINDKRSARIELKQRSLRIVRRRC